MQINTQKIRSTLSHQQGLSLIELMIAMTLGLMIVAGMATLFVQTRKSFTQDEMIAQMQDDARFAMNEIVRDVSLGGFWATLLDPSAITTEAAANLGTDCGDGTAKWMYLTQLPVTAISSFDEPGAANNPSDNFDCLVDVEVQADTDIISIKRVVGNPIAVGALVNNTMYLETNGVTGQLFEQVTARAPVVTGTVTYWEYRPSIYFVQNYENTAGDGVPTLCRSTLVYVVGTAPAMTKECLASGVEDMQIEYGIDTDNDGTANQYISAPTAAQLATLVSVRFLFLFRTVNSDPSYTSNKTFTIGNAAVYSPTDNFYRRVYTITVNVRNPTNLRTIT